MPKFQVSLVYIRKWIVEQPTEEAAKNKAREEVECLSVQDLDFHNATAVDLDADEKEDDRRAQMFNNLTFNQKRYIMGTMDAKAFHDDCSLRDIFDMHMSGIRGYEEMTDAELLEKWESYFPNDGDVQQHWELINNQVGWNDVADLG